jgi:hypothetical protein
MTTVYNSQVQNPSYTVPSSLSVSLTSNGVALWDSSSSATVKAVLFNAISVGSANWVKATITNPSVVMQIDRVYHNSELAVQLTDNRVTYFTFNSGAAAQNPSLSGYYTNSAEDRRRFATNG